MVMCGGGTVACAAVVSGVVFVVVLNGLIVSMFDFNW